MHTYEAIYEAGVIRLSDSIRLPEHTKVFVIVPDVGEEPGYRMGSPRLAHPEQAVEFVKQVVVEGSDAPLR